MNHDLDPPKPRLIRKGAHYIIMPGQALVTPRLEWFDVEFWHTRKAAVAASEGRGQTWFLDQDEQRWVLRHYLRGGLLGKKLGDRYFWNGAKHSRAFHEVQLLDWLHAKGMPVPVPIGAHLFRRGFTYRSDLITVWLPESDPLTRWLARDAVSPTLRQQIGECIRRFHRLGVDHCDITVQNVLLDRAGKIYLIDFDRARVKKSEGSWCEKNLKRFYRSLNKWSEHQRGLPFPAEHWRDFLRGYDSKKYK